MLQNTLKARKGQIHFRVYCRQYYHLAFASYRVLNSNPEPTCIITLHLQVIES